MQIRNSKLCKSSKCCKLPLVDEHAFQPTGFAVMWLSSAVPYTFLTYFLSYLLTLL